MGVPKKRGKQENFHPLNYLYQHQKYTRLGGMFLFQAVAEKKTERCFKSFRNNNN
jgi:hypothetical protein